MLCLFYVCEVLLVGVVTAAIHIYYIASWLWFLFTLMNFIYYKTIWMNCKMAKKNNKNNKNGKTKGKQLQIPGKHTLIPAVQLENFFKWN